MINISNCYTLEEIEEVFLESLSFMWYRINFYSKIPNRNKLPEMVLIAIENLEYRFLVKERNFLKILFSEQAIAIESIQKFKSFLDLDSETTIEAIELIKRNNHWILHDYFDLFKKDFTQYKNLSIEDSFKRTYFGFCLQNKKVIEYINKYCKPINSKIDAYCKDLLKNLKEQMID